MDCSILIVDDDAFFRRMLVKAMLALECEFTLCVDGRECLEVVNSEVFDYDMVLMDVHMPEMLGSEVTTIIRTLINNSLQKAPIIAMTSDSSWCDQARCETAGFSGFLKKPADTRALHDTLSQALPMWLNAPESELAKTA